MERMKTKSSILTVLKILPNDTRYYCSVLNLSFKDLKIGLENCLVNGLEYVR